MEITIESEKIHLLPEKAIYWPKKKLLVVADIHLGKAATFRSLGVPIPEGCMQEDLNRLTTLLANKEVTQCIIAGDLIHAKQGLSPFTITLFSKWLSGVKSEVHLIFGNHDGSLVKSLPTGWNLICHSERLLIEPFVFRHHPVEDPEGYVWSGHLHPCTKIYYNKMELKLPCFVVGTRVGILPAFSSFVSGLAHAKEVTQKIYAVTEKNVYER